MLNILFILLSIFFIYSFIYSCVIFLFFHHPAVSLGAVCTGTTLAWTSPVVPQLLQPANSTAPDPAALTLTETQCGIVGSMLAVGALISSLPAGFIAEKFGRKYTIISLAVPFIFNWGLIVLASNALMLYVARFFAGLAVGAICVCAPMYIGEIASPSIRGKLGSFFQMFLCGGILLTYALGAVLPWTTLSAVLGIFPLLFAGCFFFMPESPIYLVKLEDFEAAGESLKFFRGEMYNVREEIEDLKADVKESQGKKSSLKDVLASKGNRKALLSALGIMAFQQLSGINAVIFYTVPIFQSAGSSLSPDLSGILVGILQLIAAYAAVMLIEKANRRFFLMLSSSGMFLCLVLLGIYFHLQKTVSEASGTLPSGIGLMPIGSLLAFIIFFSFGFGPVPWMVMSELFAPEIKGLGSGLAVMTNWILVFVVTFAFPVMNTHLGGHVTFYIFSGFMLLGIFFTYFVIPETRGKTLQQIQAILNK